MSTLYVTETGARLEKEYQKLLVTKEDQVLLAVNGRRRSVSRASVYNVLHSLCAAGLVREVVAGDAVVRYDARTERHDHFLCRVCGQLEDLPPSRLPALPALGPHIVESSEILFRGLCPACAPSRA